MKLAAKSLLFVSLAVSFAFTQNTPNTPFTHVIIVVQENRSPDNLFGSDLHHTGGRRLPNAHLASSGHCGNVVVPLQPLNLDSCADQDHSHAAGPTYKGGWETTYDSGNMDGACNLATYTSHCNGRIPSCIGLNTCPYAYVDNTAVAPSNYGLVEPYFQIALNYGYANWMFQTNQGPSFPAHQFLFTGTSAPDAFDDPHQNCGSLPCWQWFAAENTEKNAATYGCIAAEKTVLLEADPAGNESAGYQPPYFPWPDAGFPCYEHATMTDLLEHNSQGSFSWRFYGYSPGEGYLWNAPDAIYHICQPNGGTCSGPDWSNGKIVLDDTQVMRDLGAGPPPNGCNLQAVSWVIPDGNWSDHPGKPGEDAGPSWVAGIVNAVGGYNNDGTPLPVQCGYWNNTVVLVTWDDWGGFYDDVLPWNCASAVNGGKCSGYSNNTGQQYVYGFRVPLLVVSAWSKPNYISGDPSGPVQPYVHDFGSILNFTEWALGNNQNFIGEISPNYHYADLLAPDARASCDPSKCPQPWSLADFFLPFTPQNQRSFTKVIGANYPTSCFVTQQAAKGCFPSYPSDPDNDAQEGQ